MKPWQFYGRSPYLDELSAILDRRRWFFASITGRRRIGKTTLVQQVSRLHPDRPVFYVQIPDSDEPGIISAVHDALDSFEVSREVVLPPRNLPEFVKVIDALVRNGFVIVLDEFQYFRRAKFSEFCSLLQGMVDRFASPITPPPVRPGGLIVLGSIYTDMVALLEDRSAPLYARTTDAFNLPHLDMASVMAIIRDHADFSPQRLLFLWTLFEGVPKFYRDCYERQVLDADRSTLLRRLFFDSAAPLQTEADHWFLHELHGRYDTVLKFVARHPGRFHGELVDAVRKAGGKDDTQIGIYLKSLTDDFRLVRRKLPIFAPEGSRKGRYYITDNFLQSWLGALANFVVARNFQPLDGLIAKADQRLVDVEGYAFERMIAQLYEERSRKGLPGFSLQRQVDGYWDKGGIEIDFVAESLDEERIRFGTCKRSPQKLLAALSNLRRHVERFLDQFPKYRSWQIELAGFAPELDDRARSVLHQHDFIAQDLVDLTRDLV